MGACGATLVRPGVVAPGCQVSSRRARRFVVWVIAALSSSISSSETHTSSRAGFARRNDVDGMGARASKQGPTGRTGRRRLKSVACTAAGARWATSLSADESPHRASRTDKSDAEGAFAPRLRRAGVPTWASTRAWDSGKRESKEPHCESMPYGIRRRGVWGWSSRGATPRKPRDE